MKFIVADRESVERGLLVHTAYVLISIRDPDKRAVKVRAQPGLRGVLSLAFHDAEPVRGFQLPGGIRLMTEDQARDIWAFVRQRPAEVGTIVVHCEQGMSRSPAVAAALCTGLGGDDREFWREYMPNMYVYQRMIDNLCNDSAQAEL